MGYLGKCLFMYKLLYILFGQLCDKLWQLFIPTSGHTDCRVDDDEQVNNIHQIFSRPRVDRICIVHLLIAVVIVLVEAITDVVFVNDVTG